MFHLIAFEEAIDDTVNLELDLVPDQIANGDAGQAYFQDDMQLIMAYLSAPTLLRGRLISPKLRQIYVPYFVPFTAALLPPNDPNVVDMRNRPLSLRRLERFVPELTSGLACGTEQSYCVLAFTQGLQEAPFGEVTTLRATGAATLVQATWVDVPLVFDQQLADGRYAIIGGQLQSATAIAWRLILSNQVWRPGGLGQAALGSRTHRMFYDGGLGKWGEFVNTNLPRLQVMANAGDSAQNLFLQVVRVGSQ